MIEIILLILTLIIVGMAFNLQVRSELKYRRQRERNDRLIRAAEKELPHNNHRGPSTDGPYEGKESDRRTVETEFDEMEKRTRSLIGEDAYKRMTDMIDKVLRTHCGEPCLSVSLTCGPDTEAGSKILHSLLPGMELNLVACGERGVECIDVFHQGARVGRLALSEAELVRETLKGSSIKGVYVAEQNCYGLEDRLQLSIIIFYDSLKVSPIREIADKLILHNGRRYLNAEHICQN